MKSLRYFLLALLAVCSCSSYARMNMATRMALRNTMHHHRMNNLRNHSHHSTSYRDDDNDNKCGKRSNQMTYFEVHEPNLEKAKAAHKYFDGKIRLSLYHQGDIMTLIPPFGDYGNWEKDDFSVTPGWLVISQLDKRRNDGSTRWYVIYKDGIVYEYSYVAI